jgi:AcrR family transcriptional regulator
VTGGRPRSDSARTRERLLDTAERLFATHGLHAVSLRTINTEAGARNVSAAHYHFGSKTGVIAGRRRPARSA